MVLILKISSRYSAASAVLKADLACREGPTSNLVKLLDIVQMATNLSSEDCTLIIVMVLRTRCTKSILINQAGQIYLDPCVWLDY